MTVTYSMPTGQGQSQGISSFDEYISVANQLSNQLAQMAANTSAFTQQDAAYNLVKVKNGKIRNLRESISKNFSGKIYLTDHIFHAVKYKPNHADIEFFNVSTVGEIIENSIVILSNNNVMTNNNIDQYMQLYLRNPSSVFVIWDFDNHHWLALSGVLAALCDLYTPTHFDNLESLSRLNNVIAGPVCSGVIQWTKEFLTENLDTIMYSERTNDPLGTHISYPQFINRHKNLEILNRTLANVKSVDGSYHSRDIMDRFKEWCSHKSHWIVPVLNDVPIRLFDSLITGGVPIVPRSLKYHPAIANLHDHILFYDYEDIQNPLPITERANNLFDKRGTQGILDRHQISYYNNHVDNRIETILKAVQDEFCIPRLV